MRILLAPTEDFVRGERTKLAEDVAAGSNVSLVLENNNGFFEGGFLVIGREGSELAELEQVNQAITGNTQIRVAALKFAHKKGEPVVMYRFDKRKFYGALSSTGGFTELVSDGSPEQIKVDDPQGTMLEYSGTEGYEYFKATYYNSETTEETEIGDSEAVQGDPSGRYTSLYNIRVQAGMVNNPFIDDGRIERKRRQAENEINSMLFGHYVLPLAEVPPMVQHICELLAAGYIDFEEFGPDGNGVKWLGEARGILKSIGKNMQRLIASDGTEMAVVGNTNVLRGKPDGSETGNDSRMFRISDKY